MRLYEFYDTIDLEEPGALDTIKSECSNAISSYKRADRVLYRGIPFSEITAFKASTPTNRPPRDMEATVAHYIDTWFKKHGVAANRSNSIFTSSLYSDGLHYASGDKSGVYVIFPVNGFHFTYSVALHDLWIEMPRGLKMHPNYAESPWNNNLIKRYGFETPPPLETLIHAIMDKAEFRHADFTAAVKSENEVLIHGQYYALQYHLYEYNIQKLIHA